MIAPAAAVFLMAATLLPATAHAESSRACSTPKELTPTQQDRLLRFAAVARDELERAGRDVALVARSGTDLSRFGERYSHAGLSLRDSANTRWSVRQLYYDCDVSRPRIFDQGLAGFLLDTDEPSLGYLSIVTLPEPPSRVLATTALDDRRALGLLGATYSANAYAFADRYQNCNQWVMELLATAWGALPDGRDLRARAQQWLAASDYEPHRFTVTNPFIWLAGQFVPWLHNGDHPQADLENMTYRVSMPSSIERFARARVPGAERVELCHTDTHIVVRRGWDGIGEGCRAGVGDRVVRFEE